MIDFLFSDIYFTIFMFTVAVILCLSLILLSRFKPVLYVLIPLILMVSLTSYFVINNMLGLPTKNFNFLDEKFIVLHYIPDYELKKIYITARIAKTNIPKLYVVDDPDGKVKKQLDEAKKKSEGGRIPIIGQYNQEGRSGFYAPGDFQFDILRMSPIQK